MSAIKLPLDVVSMCSDCRRGYVYTNPNNPQPKCLACGGLIKAIAPIPNVYGAFVPTGLDKEQKHE